MLKSQPKQNRKKRKLKGLHLLLKTKKLNNLSKPQRKIWKEKGSRRESNLKKNRPQLSNKNQRKNNNTARKFRN